ncbi:N-acetylmuramic acid 6-phosphate etherase [Sphingomonas sp. SFZ2018-12]|uniref:N-acetylmuramic acid 6-phosphate etherase n=1 Tax=Sphingomonas sp. SFZ2018-12 TaxID=2683197 RepID=UPI001F0E918C|nr:N-acetylmuramic acid 6-phosphate etherase [Sphingomonas sp. SFZ2018-12]MCH4893283.1 N-acetylmuramic acid 6-phosphate etherase [Sphingomonas sp. SFZ2018-12]
MRKTEGIDPRFVELDSWPTATAVEAMLEGQLSAAAAVQGQVGAIAAAADRAAERLGSDGRLVFAGAGTSGRIAVQDGVELGPTFGWPAARTVFLLAGGMDALAQSAEGAEDDGPRARADVAAHRIGANDVMVGVAASGRTPFTIAAIEAARTAGALTIAIANNPATPLLAAAELAITLDTGAETIAGSTRMKAGTAQKIALNLLSTAIMLRLGRVYRGRMVDMVISNAKLRDRAERMVGDLADVPVDRAAAALDRADNDIKLGVLVARGLDTDAARALLARAGGRLRDAMALLDMEAGR